MRDGRDRLRQAYLCTRNIRFCGRDQAVFVDQGRDFSQRLLLLVRLPVEAAANYRQHYNHRRDCRAEPPLFASLAFGAPVNVVGGKSNQTGDHLGQRKLKPVALFTQIGRQHIDGSIRDRAIRRDGKAQGWRKALVLRIARLAIDDQRDHRPVGMTRFELAQLFVDEFAARRMRGRENDQRH